MVTKMNIEDIIKIEKETIKQYIKDDLNSSIGFINEVNDYSFSHTGKLIRPLLTVAVAKAFNYSNEDIIYKLATMIEYIHTATLLHDDVVDDSDLRRGNPTVKKQFSNPVAVLVGDFIYTRAFQLMLVADSLAIMKTMADVTNKISEGEIMQLLNIGNYDVNMEKYLQVIDAKTANLFVAAVKVAGIIANLSEVQINLLSTFARNLGILFQMVDDVMDYTSKSDQMGKNTGDDLQEGKVTLPIILLIAKANDQDKKEIINMLTNHIDNIGESIEQINLIFNKYNVINECQKTIQTYYNEALISLDLLIKDANMNYNSKYIELLKHLLSASMRRVN